MERMLYIFKCSSLCITTSNNIFICLYFLAGTQRWNTIWICRQIFFTYFGKSMYGRRPENKHRKHVVLIAKSMDFILFFWKSWLYFHLRGYKIWKTWTILDFLFMSPGGISLCSLDIWLLQRSWTPMQSSTSVSFLSLLTLERKMRIPLFSQTPEREPLEWYQWVESWLLMLGLTSSYKQRK